MIVIHFASTSDKRNGKVRLDWFSTIDLILQETLQYILSQILQQDNNWFMI